LERKGLRATVVHDRDSEGRISQQVIFPWAQVIKGNDTINVRLLQNIQGNTGIENLNISIESLEFELTDAIRILTRKDVPSIAFIKDNEKLHELIRYRDIIEALDDYFQVDIGQLDSDPTVLDPYKAVIIANPYSRFSESDKFIIDQYIMHGGRVLWLIDGVRVSMDTLAMYGFSPALPIDLNLNDQLFRYGVRINADLLMDVNSVLIPVDKAREGDRPNFQPAPWYFSPLLLTSPHHPVSRNVPVVKADFASSIDFVGNDPNIHKEVLLITSQHSRAIRTPTRVSLDVMNIPADPAFFNQQHFPVAVALEGIFPSVFQTRFPPQNVISPRTIKTQSVPTRMIVVADGDIIRNDVQGVGVNARALPLGFDSYMNQEFGNRSFIMNAVLYLTDDDGWLNLRSRVLTIRLLDKITVNKNKRTIQIVNVAMPVLLLIIFAIVNTIIRKRKYSK
jgi:ABC-2 type transport system permease protein